MTRHKPPAQRAAPHETSRARRTRATVPSAMATGPKENSPERPSGRDSSALATSEVDVAKLDVDPEASSTAEAVAQRRARPLAINEGRPPVPPPSALQSAAAFGEWLKSLGQPPDSYAVGDDLDWNAPWVVVRLKVELPFWIFVENTALQVEVEGHVFPVSTHLERFELHTEMISDSKQWVIYEGPIRQDDDLFESIKAFRRSKPNAQLLWRKAKSVLTIVTRCNEDVWRKRTEEPPPVRPSVALYLDELCRAHIPVVNKLIQAYRLATYDPFAFEVAPWDVPHWFIERDNEGCSCTIVPYRLWDYPTSGHSGPDGQLQPYRLIGAEALRANMSPQASPGELELLDAINFMERGNYSDAIRRITTAIEGIVAAVTEDIVNTKEGPQAAKRFLEDTRVNFQRRVKKYEQLSGRILPNGMQRELDHTRKLRHRIVHSGYRVTPAERGSAQKSVDFGRWTFNWFEDDTIRREVREQRIVLRSLGREMTYNIFRPQITPEGITLSPLR